MINPAQIKPDTPVVCSKNGKFAIVDHMEGRDTVKLKKDKQGQHHFIPLSWVTKVDDKVHVDRPGDQAMKEWSTSSKATMSQASGAKPKTKSDEAMIAQATNEGLQHAPTTPKS